MYFHSYCSRTVLIAICALAAGLCPITRAGDKSDLFTKDQLNRLRIGMPQHLRWMSVEEWKDANRLMKLVRADSGNREKHLRAAAALGVTEAMCLLGDAAKTPAESARWYRQALTKDGQSREATGFETRPDDEVWGASDLLRKTDMHGQAARRMAVWLVQKKLNAIGKESPEFYFSIAVGRDDGEAHLLWAELLMQRKNATSVREAAKLLEKLIKSRRSDKETPHLFGNAAFHLGMIYLRTGAQKPEVALDLLERAAAQGNLLAAEIAGRVLLEGAGTVGADHKKAITLIQGAACGNYFKAGLVSSKILLVNIYVDGRFTKKDLPRAATILVQLAWIAAADPKHAQAVRRYRAKFDQLVATPEDVDLTFQLKMISMCEEKLSMMATVDKAQKSGINLSDRTQFLKVLGNLPMNNPHARAQRAAFMAPTDPAGARAEMQAAADLDLPEACQVLTKWLLDSKYGEVNRAAAGRYAQRGAELFARMGFTGRAHTLIPYIRKILGDKEADTITSLTKLAYKNGLADRRAGR